jgi:hypothetical protein
MLCRKDWVRTQNLVIPSPALCQLQICAFNDSTNHRPYGSVPARPSTDPQQLGRRFGRAAPRICGPARRRERKEPGRPVQPVKLFELFESAGPGRNHVWCSCAAGTGQPTLQGWAHDNRISCAMGRSVKKCALDTVTCLHGILLTVSAAA